MEKKDKKLFSEEELQNMKDSLPGKYYPQFKKVWGTKFKTKAPSRQSVYSVKNGISEDDRILIVLIQMIRDRNELRDQLNQATKYNPVSHGVKQEAQATH